MSEVTINGLSERDWKLAAAMASVQDHTIAALNDRLTAEKLAAETIAAKALTELEQKMDELDTVKGAADAWGAVFSHCLNLGMNVSPTEDIVKTVEQFISEAVTPKPAFRLKWGNSSMSIPHKGETVALQSLQEHLAKLENPAFEVTHFSESRPIEYLRGAGDRIVEMIPGVITSRVTFRRAGGEEKEFVVTEEMAQFFMKQPDKDPLHEALEGIAACGAEIDYSDWAVWRANRAITDYKAGDAGALLKCIEQLASGNYQGAGYTGYATKWAAEALQRYRTEQAGR